MSRVSALPKALWESFWSLREHDIYHPTYSPDIRFNHNDGASVLKVDSYEAGTYSMGQGFCFIVLNRAWLNGKYVRFRWNGIGPTNLNYAYAQIYDGEYVRSSDTDFPFGAGIPTKGAGLLQTLATRKGTGSVEAFNTVDALINVSGGNQAKCTLFFLLTDAWSGQRIYINVDWVEINTGAGGSGNLYVENFTATVVMEVTGSHGDYGHAP